MEEKEYIYKIIGELEFTRDIPNLTSFLSQVEEVKLSSIKVSSCTGDCKFKIKITESELREFISVICMKLSFKIKKIKRVLF